MVKSEEILGLIIVNVIAISLLLLSIMVGPFILRIIPFDITNPKEPIELVIPTYIFSYTFLFCLGFSIAAIINDYYKSLIKYEIINLESLDIDVIKVKGEVIQVLKSSVDFIKNFQDQYNEVGYLISDILFINNKFFNSNYEKDGIYVFFRSNNKKEMYIGKSERILTRVKNHEKLKEDRFDNLLLFTCIDDNFGGSILKGLESKLIKTLKKKGIYQIDNKQEKSYSYVEYYDRYLIEKYHNLIIKIIDRFCT